MNARTESAASAQRLVLFVGGFDPRGARHYHQLMRQEAHRQSQASHCRYEVGSRQRWAPGVAAGLEHAQWSVSAAQGQAAQYVFYEWSDVVRSHWPRSRWSVARQALQTYALAWKARRCLKPLHQHTPYTLWTLAYPLVYALLFVLLALAAAFGVWAGLAGQGPVVAAVGAAVAAGLVGMCGWKLDGVLHVSWILRILNFARIAAQQGLEPLQQRHAATARVLARELAAQPQRELVVVGFSVGSAMALDLLHVLRQQLDAQAWRRVRFVTLGNCIPLFTLMPAAVQLRARLLSLAQDDGWFWADISAPGDSVSFGMCNLVQLSMPDGLDAAAAAQLRNPRHMCSPRFHKLFRPATYRWLRRNKMRMHFQYLMAGELPGAYDYFALLTHAGPVEDFICKRLVR